MAGFNFPNKENATKTRTTRVLDDGSNMAESEWTRSPAALYVYGERNNSANGIEIIVGGRVRRAVLRVLNGNSTRPADKRR